MTSDRPGLLRRATDLDSVDTDADGRWRTAAALTCACGLVGFEPTTDPPRVAARMGELLWLPEADSEVSDEGSANGN